MNSNLWGSKQSIYFDPYLLQESDTIPDNILLYLGRFCVLLGPPSTTYEMVVQACSQCSSRVSPGFVFLFEA